LPVAPNGFEARCLTQTAAETFFCVLFANRATPRETMVVAAPGWTPANSQSAWNPSRRLAAAGGPPLSAVDTPVNGVFWQPFETGKRSPCTGRVRAKFRAAA